MAALTILTWFWTQSGGRATYTAAHVNIWAAMVRRHLTLPHRLACVTDMPGGIDPSIEIITPPGEFEDAEIPTWSGDKPQCLRRVALFRPDAAEIFGERFVSMDLDCVIAGSLDPLFDRPEDIVLYASPLGTMTPSRPYNGSMIMMTAGARPEVYTTFSQAGAEEAGRRYAGSDQAWISHVLGRGEATWSEIDDVVWYGRARHVIHPRLVFYPGNPKPWQLCRYDPFVHRHYRGYAAGRALILGHAPSVWEHAERALASGPFDAVIASPEAAAHWTGPLLAVARDDTEADLLAAMHGYADTVWCGRSEREA